MLSRHPGMGSIKWEYAKKHIRKIVKTQKKAYICGNLDIMAKDLSEQLNRIGHKAELLVTRYITLREDNQRLESRVQELETELETSRRRIERLQTEVEHFKISSALAPDSRTASETRAIITRIVREIDACVADLMKDV